MNKARRIEIDRITIQLDELKRRIDLVLEGEQESFENMPESFQYAEKGEKVQDAIINIELALEKIDEMIENLEEAKA